MIDPYHLYGEEFYCGPFSIRLNDGRTNDAYDVVLCIRPKDSRDATLEHAWQKFREIASWVCAWSSSHSSKLSYRVVIAWSKAVRPTQGHIFKVWADRQGICSAAKFESYEDYAKATKSFWIPLSRWEKDVFEPDPA
jgi:hypothetical protein